MPSLCRLLLGVLLVQARPAEADAFTDAFAIRKADCIMDEAHMGLVNGMATAGVRHSRVGSVDGLWSPPHVSSDFLLEARVGGESIPAVDYTWLPYRIAAQGNVNGLDIAADTVLVDGVRGGLVHVRVHNPGPEDAKIPLAFTAGGTLDKTNVWEFSTTLSKSPARAAETPDGVLWRGKDGVFGVAVAGGAFDGTQWAAPMTVPPGESRETAAAFAIGGEGEVRAALRRILEDPARAHADTAAAWQARMEDLFSKLPRLESDNPALDAWYNRSLLHLLMNRWNLPEMVLQPYYGTGSVRGGCLCEYLWNFGEVWEILPLCDPEAAKAHIRQFLSVDITKHFAFMPLTGEAFGPWYPVNQEKITGLVYWLVKNTGDTAFLSETVNGKTVLDWMVENALVGDDPARPVALIDYGPSNSHLELRRGYPYNHVMPDLNGRRYDTYLRVAELCDTAGKPMPLLRERAVRLKEVLRRELWNPELRWFHFKNGEGVPDTRYTIQLFKLFKSPVLDPDQVEGLLSHLNETEFLSPFGLHSLSKTDVAYDQVDIDNGGGGSCTCFPPQIAERLYKAGHSAPADDLLRRILWWGSRMPYWGDSLVANAADYRKDTPLQCTIDGATAAQAVIFGLFGIEAAMDGSVTIAPKPTTLAGEISLKGVRLRGKHFDVRLKTGGFVVRIGGDEKTAQTGGFLRLD